LAGFCENRENSSAVIPFRKTGCKNLYPVRKNPAGIFAIGRKPGAKIPAAIIRTIDHDPIGKQIAIVLMLPFTS
jgi:hypothetical protein